MQREKCPDCGKTYLRNIYRSKSENYKEAFIIAGKFCPVCHYTIYTETKPNVILSPKESQEKAHSSDKDYIKIIRIPPKITPEIIKMISTKIENPRNLEETKKLFKDNLETIAILKHISQKDLEVKDLVNRGYSVYDITKFVTIRELKKYSENDILKAIDQLNLYHYEGLSFDRILSRLFTTKDYERVMDWLERNKKYLNERKNQNSTEEASGGA